MHALIRPAALALLDGRSRLLVGLSGGLDSTVLLHVLSRQLQFADYQVRAIHIHHGLQAQADQWAEHCRALCTGLGVSLIVVNVDVARHQSGGIEAAARKARHAACESALRDDEVLALAHHRDDQAETFLLRALRASGPDGLGAMRPWRGFGRGWMWRPWLDVPRADLLAYAQAHALAWIEDPSNTDTDRDRNFIRHRVLPLLRERWPQAGAAFARSASLHAEVARLLDDDARALATAQTIDPHTLSVDALHVLPATRQARVLRRWISSLGLPPLPAQGVAHIRGDLLDAAPDSEPVFTWAGARVLRWRDLLHAHWQRPSLPADWRVDWDGCAALKLPTGDTMSLQVRASSATTPVDGGQGAAEAAPAFASPITVHARTGGERITLPGRGHSHSLKRVLQALGVPPWERARLPLLSNADGRLLAAGDLIYAAPFDAWLRERGARLQWTHS